MAGTPAVGTERGFFNMKKNICLSLCLILLAGILLPSGSLAEDYSFSDAAFRFSLPKGVYDKVITASNYEDQAEFLQSQGYDMDETAFRFTENGLRLIAFDTKNSRHLEVTALQDVDAKNYFDLNQQGEDMRKNYRVSHSDGSAYGLLGYNYTSATWKNYGTNVDRFLQTLYTLRVGGTLVASGAQRRTIRNGYTITLDMMVTGRSRTDADVKALETIMKTFVFTSIYPMPELPIKLILTNEPPTETHDETLTIKGTSLAKAEIRVSLISVSGTQSTAFSVTANGSGKFSVKVKFPSRGVYALTLTASRSGSLDAVRTYTVSYDPNQLIARVTQGVPDELDRETVIKGTTEGGVSAQLIVTGPIEYTKTTTSKSFSFTVDTSREGTYHFRLVLTKKGFNERSFEYSGIRSLNAAERRDQIRSEAIKPEYSRLVADSASYNGRIFGYTGYLTDYREGSGDYLYTIALSRTNGKYKQFIYVASENPVSFNAGDKVKVYATKTGEIVTINENGNAEKIPLFDILFMESAQ